MKKNYMAPALFEQLVQAEQMIANSVASVGGNAGITLGEGETPTEADVKGNPFGDSIFE